MQEFDDFSKLLLSELQSNRQAIDSLRTDIDTKLESIRKDISKLQSTEKEIAEIKTWQKEVTETWSPRQMKEAKDEIYEQKNRWSKAIGILIVVEIIIGIIISVVIKNLS